jgi:hypothetical protein
MEVKKPLPFVGITYFYNNHTLLLCLKGENTIWGFVIWKKDTREYVSLW